MRLAAAVALPTADEADKEGTRLGRAAGKVRPPVTSEVAADEGGRAGRAADKVCLPMTSDVALTVPVRKERALTAALLLLEPSTASFATSEVDDAAEVPSAGVDAVKEAEVVATSSPAADAAADGATAAVADGLVGGAMVVLRMPARPSLMEFLQAYVHGSIR